MAVRKVLNKVNYRAPIVENNMQKELEKHIEIPKRASDNLKIIEYLTNRGIDESILNYCIINNLIYQRKDNK